MSYAHSLGRTGMPGTWNVGVWIAGTNFMHRRYCHGRSDGYADSCWLLDYDYICCAGVGSIRRNGVLTRVRLGDNRGEYGIAEWTCGRILDYQSDERNLGEMHDIWTD